MGKIKDEEDVKDVKDGGRRMGRRQRRRHGKSWTAEERHGVLMVKSWKAEEAGVKVVAPLVRGGRGKGKPR